MQYQFLVTIYLTVILSFGVAVSDILTWKAKTSRYFSQTSSLVGLQDSANSVNCTVAQHLVGRHSIDFHDLRFPCAKGGCLSLKANGTYSYKPDDLEALEGADAKFFEKNRKGTYTIDYCYSVSGRTLIKKIPPGAYLAKVTCHNAGSHSSSMTIQHLQRPIQEIQEGLEQPMPIRMLKDGW